MESLSSFMDLFDPEMRDVPAIPVRDLIESADSITTIAHRGALSSGIHPSVAKVTLNDG